MAGMTELRVVPESLRREESTAAMREWAGPTVPPGHVVLTGYVQVEDVVCLVQLASQLNPAAVERAYREQLAEGASQAWPPPSGYWREDGRFVLTDGRHRFVAALMLGMRHLFVCWLRPALEE
jgi:hypothetical protein